MEADWDELTRINESPDPSAVTIPAATFAFDNLQDLLWVGDEYGKLTSYYGTLLKLYTSVIAHPEDHSPVKQILFADRGVLSVAPGSVNYVTRRGLNIWHLAEEEGMQDLRCMALMGRGDAAIGLRTGTITAKSLVVGGCQEHLLTIDIARGEVVERIKATAQYTMMRRTGAYILAATQTGQIHVLNPESLSIINTLTSNNAFFNDMDARNNYLVTCGWINRPQGTPMLSIMANVYDLKTFKQLTPISFHAGAAHVQMHPKMSTTCIIASQSGHIQEVDIANPTVVSVRQANIRLAMQGLTMAPSGDAFAIADASGAISLWGSPARQSFVEMAHPTETADPIPDSMSMGIDEPVSLGQIVPMPYYRDPLLSIWSDEYVYETGRPSVRIPAEVLNNLKPNGGAGMWAPNPFEKRKDYVRNFIRDATNPENEHTSVVAPKFLSEKDQRRDPKQHVERRISDIQDLVDGVAPMGITKNEVPLMYRNVEIKYSRFGVDDFDFKYYNKTKFSGLETHIANSYVNPLLQLLKFTPFVRNLALEHTAANCLSEVCLLCELGFLFDTLEKADGQSCQATNFLKAFSNVPEAARLNLLEEYSHPTSLAEMIQSAGRFLLSQIANDFRRVSGTNKAFEQIFAIDAVQTMRCNSCHNEMVKPGTTLTTDLNYSPPPGSRSPRNQIPTFSQILKQSIDFSSQSRGWCDRCKRYQNLQTKRNLKNMPDVLMLSALAKISEAKRLWAQPGWLPERIGISIDGSKFVCFEGEDLRLHLERNMYTLKLYDLVGVVADVHSAEQQKPHLVSLVNVALSEREATEENDWHLFNDFLVRKLPKDELSFPNWKVPALVVFQAASGRHAVDDSWRESLDTSLLYNSWTSNDIPPERCRPLDKNLEIPQAGDPIAIDTEFVALQQEEIEIKADGEREVIRPTRMALARVSVLRCLGDDEGLPFINDWITITEPIVDYLTKYSGVTEGDLDPKVSTRPLVPLKVAYKKLWLLVNLGCVFIGHGLPKDLRTINIHIPKSQILDTVNLFFIPSRKRRLNLRFLSWFLLKDNIQQDNHDSIEDALSALRLWRKYEEFKDAGVVETMLEEIYREGKKWGFKPPAESQNQFKQLLEGEAGGLTLDGVATGRQTPDMEGGGVSGTGTPATSGRVHVRIRSAEFESPGR